MRIEKDLYITEVRLSRIANAPYVIEAVGRYENRLTLKEENLQEWSIDPSKELLRNTIQILLESKPISPDTEETDLLIEHIEKVERRRFRQIPSPQFVDEVEYVLKLQTPRGDSMSLPCPNLELMLDLSEPEYEELIALPADTALRVSCKIR